MGSVEWLNQHRNYCSLPFLLSHIQFVSPGEVSPCDHHVSGSSSVRGRWTRASWDTALVTVRFLMFDRSPCQMGEALENSSCNMQWFFRYASGPLTVTVDSVYRHYIPGLLDLCWALGHFTCMKHDTCWSRPPAVFNHRRGFRASLVSLATPKATYTIWHLVVFPSLAAAVPAVLALLRPPRFE